jgi:glycosyltransferase involved in cell wall biosynthesis
VDVSIVIACYNEEGHLEDSVRQIERTMAQTKYSYELIFVDDTSQDRTQKLIEEICRQQNRYKYIFHPRNVGRGGSVSDGIRLATGKWVGFLDIDLEIHCRYIPSFINELETRGDVVCAYRNYRVDPNLPVLIRHILSLGYRRLMKFQLKLPLHDTEAGFKFFNREKILPILDQCKDPGWFWDTEIMARSFYAGLSIIEIPVLFIRREDKKTTVRLFRDSLVYFQSLKKFKRNH